MSCLCRNFAVDPDCLDYYIYCDRNKDILKHFYYISVSSVAQREKTKARHRKCKGTNRGDKNNVSSQIVPLPNNLTQSSV